MQEFVSSVGLNHKSVFILRARRSFFFVNSGNTRKVWPMFESNLQLRELNGRADGEHFNSAVGEIASEATDA